KPWECAECNHQNYGTIGICDMCFTITRCANENPKRLSQDERVDLNEDFPAEYESLYYSPDDYEKNHIQWLRLCDVKLHGCQNNSPWVLFSRPLKPTDIIQGVTRRKGAWTEAYILDLYMRSELLLNGRSELWINLEDFTKYFFAVGVCKLRNEWLEETVCGKYPTYEDQTPSFISFVVEETTEIQFVLYQKLIDEETAKGTISKPRDSVLPLKERNHGRLTVNDNLEQYTRRNSDLKKQTRKDTNRRYILNLLKSEINLSVTEDSTERCVHIDDKPRPCFSK
ncbi:hypothetical protein ILUMI_13928, partial [Ignelater luminosus]